MNYRKTIVRIFTFLGGIYYFLSFMLPREISGFQFSKYQAEVGLGFMTLASMAIGLGIINILMVHGSRLVFLRRNWPASAALLSGLFGMLAIATNDWWALQSIAGQTNKVQVLKQFSELIPLHYAANKQDVPPFHIRNLKLQQALHSLLSEIESQSQTIDARLKDELDESNSKVYQRAKQDMQAASTAVRQISADLQTREQDVDTVNFEANQRLGTALSALAVAYRLVLTKSYETSLSKKVYTLLFDSLFISLGAAMFSLLGFYIAAAAYRAFRVKSMESALMMLAAFLVMLGQIPFGLWIWSGFPELRLWLLRVPNAAASRAIEIGAGIAGLIMAFRMWFSIESESYK